MKVGLSLSLSLSLVWQITVYCIDYWNAVWPTNQHMTQINLYIRLLQGQSL